MKFIFVSGGVISGVGKGLATASISLLLKSRGFKVAPIKCDPYINVDAGTMNPIVHGEVFVLDDGMETDQDLGHYERFLNQNMSRVNYMTTGQVYSSVIARERAFEFEGDCVEAVPHIPEEIIKRIEYAGKANKADIVIVEIGGTVGEYQNILYLEANRLMKLRYGDDVLHIHISYLPTPPSLGEMKSKPAQMSVKLLNSYGIQPDFLIARSEKPLDRLRREKLAIFCNVSPQNIISAPDTSFVYEIPLNLEKENLASKILKKLKLRGKRDDLVSWRNFVNKAKDTRSEVKIGIVGKYFATGDFTLTDAYISVIEAIKHAAARLRVKPNVFWIDASKVEGRGAEILAGFNGIIVPGGFGSRDVGGKILSIKYAREKKIPYLGLCFGMQLAAVEYARNVLGWRRANSTEIEPKTPHPVIHIMPEQERRLLKREYGGTMRLGEWPCVLRKGSRVLNFYKKFGGKGAIWERHRHRYEFNNKFLQDFFSNGMLISGTTPDKKLAEIIELRDHPFFVGVQFHPELKSRPLRPHPIFVGFIDAAFKNISG